MIILMFKIRDNVPGNQADALTGVRHPNLKGENYGSKILNRPSDSLIEGYLRLPAKERPRPGNVGPAYLGIIDRKRAVFDP